MRRVNLGNKKMPELKNSGILHFLGNIFLFLFLVVELYAFVHNRSPD